MARLHMTRRAIAEAEKAQADLRFLELIRSAPAAATAPAPNNAPPEMTQRFIEAQARADALEDQLAAETTRRRLAEAELEALRANGT